MLEQVAKLLGVIPQNLSIVQQRLQRAVELAKAPTAPDQNKSGAPVPNSEMDESDIVTMLTVWVNKNIYRLNNRVITFAKLDAELQLPSGSSAKHLQKIAEEKSGVKTLRRGLSTILFEGPRDDR